MQASSKNGSLDTIHGSYKSWDHQSELVYLSSHYLRMEFLEFLSTRCLVVVGALVSVYIAMKRTEQVATPTSESCTASGERGEGRWREGGRGGGGRGNVVNRYT